MSDENATVSDAVNQSQSGNDGTKTLSAEQLKAIRREDIVKAYSGYAGCGCGCLGNYTTNPSAIARLYSNAINLQAQYNLPVELDEIKGREDENIAAVVSVCLMDAHRGGEGRGRYYWLYLRPGFSLKTQAEVDAEAEKAAWAKWADEREAQIEANFKAGLASLNDMEAKVKAMTAQAYTTEQGLEIERGLKQAVSRGFTALRDAKMAAMVTVKQVRKGDIGGTTGVDFTRVRELQGKGAL